VSDPRPHVAVVGGGIAGLAAAHAVRRLAGGAVRITVYEGSGRIGGKLHGSDVAGLPVDEGAESMLARRPEGVALARAVGLADDVVHPAVEGARVATEGGLRPLPRRQLMGIPGDLRELAATGVLSLPALLRLPLDHVLPRTPVVDDVSIGRYVRARLGREVVDRLVEPLLGGVYAGHADELSLDATVPQLSGAVRMERSLLKATTQVMGSATRGGPVFAGLRGGMGVLPAAVAAASGAEVRTGAMVRELRRLSGGGWRLVVGPARAPETVAADAVILAAPAPAAARLLRRTAPFASAELAQIEYASVAILTFAFPRSAVASPLPGTGFLVPPVAGTTVKAATYASQKWGWLGEADPDTVIVRCSVGRHGDETDLQRSDDELAWLALAELQALTGLVGAPIDTRVTRWGGGVPQYAVGHLRRVSRIHTAVAEQPGLAVCGAAYDGVGVPACVASADAAARQVMRAVAAGTQWGHAEQR
jgi:oxygen-dependent protoporphyrinogen oxidase